MSVHNPPGLFTGGAVTFNSQPEVNAYANLLAKQQAKWDAMDNYERSRFNSVNESGVRDIDRKTLADKVADNRSFWGKNKKAINNGMSQEAFDYEKKWQDIKDLIAQSKDRAARHSAALQFYNYRLKQDQRLPGDFMMELHSNDMPIGEKYVDQDGQEKDYSSFDITKWASEAKPFTQDKFVKSFADIKRTPSTTRYENIPGQPLKQLEISEEAFDPNAKQVIAARAADRYDNSYSFSNQVKTEIADPTRRKQLSDLFKQEYGVEPSMPSDYAIAYTMELIQPKITKSKAVDDKSAIMAAQQKNREKNMAIQDLYTKDHIALANRYRDLREDKKQEVISGDVDAFIDDQIANGEAEAGGLAGAAISGGVSPKVLKPAPAVLESFKNPNTGASPTKITYKDGNFVLSGDPKYFTEITIPRGEYKAGLVNHVLNTAIKINQTKKPGATTSSSIPSATRSDWKKAGWNDSQIDQAVKAGKIKIN